MLPFAVVEALVAEAGLPEAAVLRLPLSLDPTGLDRLLADGIGDMSYLAQHRELRLDPSGLLPGARSLLLTVLPYDALATQPAGTLRRARYAAGADYHPLVRRLLARLGERLLAALPPGHSCRATCDSAPVNERSLAHLAGLGWIGRNALLIHPRRGSWFFLGGLLCTAEIEPRQAGAGADRCGRCTRCETRCPTAALVDRRVLSERCISYLTIEHHGVIARELAERFEGWWFGCDLCQEVCPWNRRPGGPLLARFSGAGDDEAAVLAIGPDDFDRVFAGRALRRCGYQRFRRNLLVALFSLGRSDAAASILAEGLPLVLAQAAELGLSPPPAADSMPSMRVWVNDAERELAAETTVAGLLAELGLSQQRVAVEVDRQLVRRAEQATTMLHDGARVEIVTLVGGG